MSSELTAKHQEKLNLRWKVRRKIVDANKHTNKFNMKGSWGKRWVDEPLFTVGRLGIVV